ncbi:MAG TPA: UDP-N-acetylmuramoyl-tripeptide--D-alanyl-D-alanine ligase [Bacteroidia bacterium]|nr:UDP-N-acetylmuramoyl-tripeptide--D-alanyl-D-alanine ligase [Bacteroidia bacterium]
MTFTDIPTLYGHYLRHPLVSTDTRTIPQGSLFFALKGGNFNGNKFAAQALEKGAAFAIVDEAECVSGDRFLLVPDVLQALQELARFHRDSLGKKGLNVFALTGSNGKTTTKELLARVLSVKYRTLFTQGNLNNHIGVPLTLLQLNETHEMAVVEMGANHQGEIRRLCGIADPDFGLITNIGLAHLEGFGGPEGVLKGKTELFEHLRKKNGTAFVLADDGRVMKIAEGMKTITYGTNQHAGVRGNFISADPFVRFSWETDSVTAHEVESRMVGAYNLTNLLAACAAGFYFGVPATEIDEAIASYIPSNARSQMEKRGSNTLILDCYNANPSSMEAAIENISKMPAERKILVLGDMFELGEESAKEHQRIVNFIGEKTKSATVLLIGKLFGATKDDFGGIRLADTAEAAQWMKKNQPENSLILIKGSRGMKMENVLAD